MMENPTHIFRMSYYKNIETFASDKYIAALNYKKQPQYTISYHNLNDRRGNEYQIENDTPHDFVPFYFAPYTAMQSAIFHSRVECKDRNGNNIKYQQDKELMFFVANINDIIGKYNDYCFSNKAVNQVGYQIFKEWDCDNDKINWQYFNDTPTVATISEIGYQGVCKYFLDSTPKYPDRKSIRMAEFFIKDKVAFADFCAIVVHNDEIKTYVIKFLEDNNCHIPVYVKPFCYF